MAGQRLRGTEDRYAPKVDFERMKASQEQLLSVTAIFAGCRKNLIDNARSRNSQHNFLSIDDLDTLLYLMNTIKSTEKLPIVLVGPNIKCKDSADGNGQIDAITKLRKAHKDLAVIAVTEEIDDQENGDVLKISRSVMPISAASGGLVLSKKEGTPINDFDVVEFGEEARRTSSPAFEEIKNIIDLRDAGASRVLGEGEFAGDVDSIVEELATAARKTEDVRPIICRVTNGIVEEVTPEMINQSKNTIDEFSVQYNNHMRLTGHFDAMYEGYRVLLLRAGQKILGNKIIDLGCGTGYPMAMLVGRIIIPQLRAVNELKKKISRGERIYVKQFREMDRGRIAMLSVDRSIGMLAQAKEQFDKLKRREGILEGNLTNSFLSQDIWELNSKILGQNGFGDLSTIIVSMLIHWQPARQKAEFISHVISLMPRGAAYIAVEEWPQTINPSPFLDLALMKKIERSLHPIPMENYYDMLRANGLADVPGAETVTPIDSKHGYYIKAFVK
ncbi:hypothetical protein JXA56_05390 [Candidatus Micrarchaeota archaeon]|nr:hypothetical protein [Candidatus Micrarchaeota archaeon]